MAIRVQLEQFEGPLGLLLHLIRKNEMDIYDIEITKITQQYLDYIHVMKELDLEGAGEFVSLAAWLINIKSKMLLPQYNAEDGEVTTEDPRKELVSRLLEYQQFQESTKWFKDRHVLGRDTWKRGFRELWSDGETAIILDDGGLYSMIALYRKALKKAARGVHVVMEKMQSLSARIMELKDVLIPGRPLVFLDLVPTMERTKTKLIVTFMAILELSRLGFTKIYQNEDCGPIHIDTKRLIENDVVSQVQELEVQQSTATNFAHTTVLVNDFEDDVASHWNDEPVDEAVTATQLELAATDTEIEDLEKQIADQVGFDLPAVTAQEAEMLGELSERIGAIPEINQPDEQPVVVLSPEELAAVEELSRMEIEGIPENDDPLRTAEEFEQTKKTPDKPDGEASV